MIHKKRGRWEMIINAQPATGKRGRKNTPTDEELARGEVRRKTEALIELLELEKQDLW